ncbi:MAG: Flp pilus assembly complex ATPase component TadA [Phycisphaeraceae bacterium]|nr:Flp pilus assembly complex ATPase component TadA [Phycisphaeraceae bacterium]
MTTVLNNLMRRVPQSVTATSTGSSPKIETVSLESLSQQMGITYSPDLRERKPSVQFLEYVPIGYARRHCLLGLDGDSKRLPVAIGKPDSWQCLDVLSRYLGRSIEPFFAPAEEVLRAVNQAYQSRKGQAEAAIEILDGPPEVMADVALMTSGGGGREDLLDVASRAPVIKVVNLILFEAVKILASDVHLQPTEGKLIVRFRIDGMLFDTYELPRAMHDEMVSRIKVMGKMNIAEKRLPQDGRATVQVGERIIDLRISSVPTNFGESVVIRLLDKSARLYTLNELGMPPEVLPGFRGLIRIDHGLLLVTGPTGSGKSTTLYAALQEIASRRQHIVTLEDPIEYQLPGVNQIQVNPRKGMTFATGLRSVLRQDPDIIMVGEIRDHETAVLAIQSALTGHLVFSTLHTNDAASAVTRLLDLGIEPYLVASSVVGVLAQRLVRRVCEHCAQFIDNPAEALSRLNAVPNLEHDRLRQGAGCDECRHTGYRGRLGIFEMLVIEESIRRHIQQRDTAADIKRTATSVSGSSGSMLTLRDCGVSKVRCGLTTVDEVLRVTPAPGSPAPGMNHHVTIETAV